MWGSGLERRFYDDHDRKVNGSTIHLISLLRPGTRCFTMIISVWWNLASSKLTKVRRKFNRKPWQQRQLLNECGFVLRKAPPPLSRDRRIKMKKSTINQSTKRLFVRARTNCHWLFCWFFCSGNVFVLLHTPFWIFSNGDLQGRSQKKGTELPPRGVVK